MTSVVRGLHDIGQGVETRKGVVGLGVLPVDTVHEEGSLNADAVQVVEQAFSEDRWTIVESQSERSGLGRC